MTRIQRWLNDERSRLYGEMNFAEIDTVDCVGISFFVNLQYCLYLFYGWKSTFMISLIWRTCTNKFKQKVFTNIEILLKSAGKALSFVQIMGVRFCFQRSFRIGASASVTCSGEKKLAPWKENLRFGMEWSKWNIQQTYEEWAFQTWWLLGFWGLVTSFW